MSRGLTRTGLQKWRSAPSHLRPTGTGKELVARSIHERSDRSTGPFVPVDCAAVNGTLFASHIFGHRKGAFTGAAHESSGCFRAAHGGTVFLDEIGELDLELQAKLLRVVQERVVVPLGDHKGFPVSVRVIAATNRNLKEAITRGTFREDLYYRIHVISLVTLPLKDRPEDIAPLSQHFLERLTTQHGLPRRRLSTGALAELQRYHWPGNVRQLENLLERAVVFGHDDPLNADVIREMLTDQPGFSQVGSGPMSAELVLQNAYSEAVTDDACWPTMAELERQHLLRTLRHTGFNQSATARLLGWDRNQLRRKMKKYELELPSLKPKPAGLLERQRFLEYHLFRV